MPRDLNVPLATSSTLLVFLLLVGVLPRDCPFRSLVAGNVAAATVAARPVPLLSRTRILAWSHGLSDSPVLRDIQLDFGTHSIDSIQSM